MRNFPIFDAHADTISHLYETGQSLNGNNAQIDLSHRVRKHAQFFALWGHPYEKLIDVFKRELETNKNSIVLCKSSQDAQYAWENGKLAAFLSIEGADALNCQVNMLDMVRSDGISMIGLTWNHANILCGSCMEEPERGLSAKGIDFVRRTFELGMSIDLSHAGAAAICDVITIANKVKGVVVFSHSNSQKVCEHPRNITDKQFISICELNGIVGLNLYTYFVNNASMATWQDVVVHLEHWISLGGENTIALGGDWDGVYNDDGTYNMVGDAKGVDSYGVLYDILIKRGWASIQIEKLFYKNMTRMIDSCTTQAPVIIQ